MTIVLLNCREIFQLVCPENMEGDEITFKVWVLLTWGRTGKLANADLEQDLGKKFCFTQSAPSALRI